MSKKGLAFTFDIHTKPRISDIFGNIPNIEPSEDFEILGTLKRRKRNITIFVLNHSKYYFTLGELCNTINHEVYHHVLYECNIENKHHVVINLLEMWLNL